MWIDRISEEIGLSLCLLFGRNTKSRIIGTTLSQTKTDFSHDLRKFHQKYKRQPELKDFSIFHPHLALLQLRMRDWKPRTFSELVRPGYYDRFAWYTAIFGIVFGTLGALSLVVSCVQLGLAVVALNVAQKSIELQMLQMNMSSSINS
jgi:hypothetical protein